MTPSTNMNVKWCLHALAILSRPPPPPPVQVAQASAGFETRESGSSGFSRVGFQKAKHHLFLLKADGSRSSVGSPHGYRTAVNYMHGKQTGGRKRQDPGQFPREVPHPGTRAAIRRTTRSLLRDRLRPRERQTRRERLAQGERPWPPQLRRSRPPSGDDRRLPYRLRKPRTPRRALTARQQAETPTSLRSRRAALPLAPLTGARPALLRVLRLPATRPRRYPRHQPRRYRHRRPAVTATAGPLYRHPVRSFQTRGRSRVTGSFVLATLAGLWRRLVRGVRVGPKRRARTRGRAAP